MSSVISKTKYSHMFIQFISDFGIEISMMIVITILLHQIVMQFHYSLV